MVQWLPSHRLPLPRSSPFLDHRHPPPRSETPYLSRNVHLLPLPASGSHIHPPSFLYLSIFLLFHPRCSSRLLHRFQIRVIKLAKRDGTGWSAGAATLSTFTRIDENTGNEGAQGKGRWSEVARYRYRAERRAGYLTFFTLGREQAVERSCYLLPVPPSENRVWAKVLDTFVYRYTGVHFCRDTVRKRVSLGGKRGGGGEREGERKEGRDTRYNFEHNLFARVYICARILGETTKPRLSFLFCPRSCARTPSPIFRPTSGEKVAIFEEHARIRVVRIYFARSSQG